MPKAKSVFICDQCGYQSPKWLGQCPQCQNWNTMVETAVERTQVAGFGASKNLSRSQTAKPFSLKEVPALKMERKPTGLNELDRVLGGGLVPGSIILVAGEPGIGKSSLLTNVVASLKGLYVLGEESPQQVKLRVDRMGLNSDFEVLSETQVEPIMAAIKDQPLVVVDSVQTLWTERLTGIAGSTGQIRETSQLLMHTAKQTQVPIILVGHVTKTGDIAGPKVLEHVVDTVLQFEGDSKHEFRLLRATKNRFGPTDEVGVFAMQEKGLVEVSNPAELFLGAYAQQGAVGSVVVVAMQGSRPVLIEIQALVHSTPLAMPRRIATGIDQRRLSILTAVLEKYVSLKLSDKDVFVNVAGGLNLREPAVDAGICLAIASSVKNRPLPGKTAVVGEVGLLGEVRAVSFEQKRLKEAQSQGFNRVVSAKDYPSVREMVGSLLVK